MAEISKTSKSIGENGVSSASNSKVFSREQQFSVFEDAPVYYNKINSPQSIIENLKNDIYARNSFGLPTTGKDIEQHIMMINEDNIGDIWFGYLEKTGNQLDFDILDEVGLSVEERESYVKHIWDANFKSYELNGINVDDLRKIFNAEIKKKGLIDKDVLTSLSLRLDSRCEIEDVFAGRITNNPKPFEKLNDSPNGKIDKDFKQGYTGDCWLIAGIKSLANSPKGLQILNDSIKVLPNGSVEVTLKGVNKKYVILKDEIQNSSELATGDADVRAIEIAMDRYLYENKRFDHPGINGGSAYVLYYALTGKGNKSGFSSSFAVQMAGALVPFSDAQIKKFANPNHVAVVSSNVNCGAKVVTDAKTGDSVELSRCHAYSVKGSDENNVYLINPHDTSKVIALSYEVFKDFFDQIDEFDL